MDIIGPIEGFYIISGIDYFTKKGYIKLSKTRSVESVVELIAAIHEELGIKSLILEQAKENLSAKVNKYCEENHIKLHYTYPYHHQSNGRVERFNRTLEELILKNKEGKLLTERAQKAIATYNNAYHTSIKMTPLEATLKENWEMLKAVQISKIVKFNKRHSLKEEEHKFRENNIVMLREEGILKKGSPRFKVRGRIVQVLENNAYLVQTGKGTVKRHASQLKLVVDDGLLV